MSEQISNLTQPEPDSLRCQLTELNNRSRWYSSELWQIPFAYLGVTGVVMAQLAEKAGGAYLGIGFATSAAFGMFVLIHVFRIRSSEQRAIVHLQKAESALNLPVTAQTGQGPKIFQIALVVAVAGYAIAAAFYLFR